MTVNNIGGTTRAAVTNTDINKNLDNSTADDVAVQAEDVTKSESHVGSLSVGIGADGGAGVSAASDTLLLSRNTAAELSGTDTAKKTVNGRNVAVTADQQSTVVTNAGRCGRGWRGLRCRCRSSNGSGHQTGWLRYRHHEEHHQHQQGAGNLGQARP